MTLLRRHHERHTSSRIGWLRAAVLGADDGIVSTASLMVGVAASSAPKETVLLAGIAGMVAGALSMAAGEYVSVSSQKDSEQADIDRETHELRQDPQAELRELAAIYEKRGLDTELALRVAEQLMRHDDLGAHLRDELGLEADSLARPLQAAAVSAVSFASLGLVPMIALLLAPESFRIVAIIASSLASLGVLGALGGHLGGAPKLKAAGRVLAGGSVAMAVTAAIGRVVGIVF